MKRFIIKSAIFFIITGIVGSCLSCLSDNGLRKSGLFEWAGWNDIFTGKVNDDIILFGSSRCYGSYNPGIILSESGYTCRNLGMTGYTMTQIIQRYKAYISLNPQPTIIILNVDYHTTFDITEYAYDLSQYLPYYNSSFFDDYLSKIGKTWAERNIPLLKYSDYTDVLWTGINEFFKPTQKDGNKGYINGNNSFDNRAFEQMLNNNAIIDTPCQQEAFQLCNWLIEDCRQRGIKFAFCKVPYYYQATTLFNNPQIIDKYLTETSKKYGVPIFDYSHHKIEYDSDYFMNATHLNANGADIISHLLGKDLKLLLSNE